MTVLWGIYLAHSMRAEHVAAREVAHRCLALAAEHEHPGMSALANRFMGQTLWTMGAFVDARAHLERTLELCAANQETISVVSTGSAQTTGPCIVIRFPGHSGSSATRSKPLLQPDKRSARARSMGLAFTTAFALDGGRFSELWGRIRNGPQPTLMKRCPTAPSIASQIMCSGARFIQGALLAQGGDPQLGIELMHSAFAATERITNRSRRTLYLGHSATAHASLGQPEVGLDLLDEAIQTADNARRKVF